MQRLAALVFLLGLAACAAAGTAPGPADPAAAPPGDAPVTTGEGGDPAAGPPEADAADLADRLRAEGRCVLRSVDFAPRTADLLPSAHPVLAEVVVLLRDDPALRLAIEVHSDARGSEEYNLDMSRRRAAAIRDWLVAQGIAEDRLEAHGLGSTRPLAPNSTAAGREANRRVELVSR